MNSQDIQCFYWAVEQDWIVLYSLGGMMEAEILNLPDKIKIFIYFGNIYNDYCRKIPQSIEEAKLLIEEALSKHIPTMKMITEEQVDKLKLLK